MRWQDKKWGDLAILEYGKSLRGYQKAGGRYTVFGTNGPIGWHDEPLCPDATVVVGRKGAYRGVHYSPAPCYVIDTAFYLKPKVEFDMRWAYYELLTHDIDNMDSGSAIPSTSRDEFYQLPVRFPPLHEQRAIAHILGTLDDKIELNRRVNETLEAMARAIFKSWFVDFLPVRAKMAARTQTGDPVRLPAATAAQAGAKAESRPGGTGLPKPLADLFPDSFEESELGEIPAGWRVLTVEDIAEINAWTLSRSDPLTVIDYIEVSEVMRGEISTIVRYARGGGAEQGTKATASWGHGAFYGSARPRCAFLVSTPQ